MCGEITHKSSEFLKFYKAFLLLTLCAATISAQGAGDSVFIINQTTTNNSAGVVADYLGGEIGEALQNQFPCVDYSSPEDVKAVLDAMRDKQLLTGELSQEQLADIAGAIGARYVALVSVTILPNGQTIVTARLLDTKTGNAIASESETAANAEAGFDTAESVTKKLMQSFSKIFKNRCEAHWTGSINYTHLIKATTNTEKAGAKSQSTDKKSKNMSATASISLQPMTLGFSGTYSTQARVTQNYRYVDEFTSAQTAEIPCREPGRNTYNKKVSGVFKNIRTETGSGTDVVSIFIQIAEDGKYRIYAGGVKPFKTAVKIEKSGTPADCRPVPFSNSSENEDSKNFVYIDLKGQVDPKKSDVLTGKLVEGDLETGQRTWTWNLRLVNPNRKKDTRQKN